MTLTQAAEKFKVSSLDTSALKDQEKAFQNCLTFLDGIEKNRTQNQKRTSYGLKHIVENPSDHFGIPSSQDFYTGYIYEGTFILAALSAGFTMKKTGKGLSATFNLSERGISRRAMEITNHAA